jgi:hypothetical protein
MKAFGGSEQSLNVHKAYTWINAVYALLRKCLIYIVGLPRLELGTSRLSGPLVGKGSIASCGEFPPVATARFFRRERERGQKPPPARTQGVHAKADGYETDGSLRPRSLTNLFRRFRGAENPANEVGKREPPPRNTSEIFSSVSLASDRGWRRLIDVVRVGGGVSCAPRVAPDGAHSRVVPSIYDAPLHQLTPIWRWL